MMFWFPGMIRIKSLDRPANGSRLMKVAGDKSLLNRYKAGFPAPFVRPTTQNVVGSVTPEGNNRETVARARIKPFSGKLRYVCVWSPGVLRRLPPERGFSPG